MANLWFFNPWNDLALASDSTYYTPPQAILKLEKSGESLPMWIAPPDDFVLCGPDTKKFHKQLSYAYHLAKPWNGEKIDSCIPWGWSRAVRQIFLNAGISKESMPDDSLLDGWRRLSHRRLTLSAHRWLGSKDIPIEAFDTKQCMDALRRWDKVVGKYPWSSSGRGVFSGSLKFQDSYIRRCQGAIHSQYSVIIEPYYDVIIDFAMLFRITQDAEVIFEGLSLFKNNKRAYSGNIIIPQHEIEAHIIKFCPVAKINEIKETLRTFLKKEVAPYYAGPVGIDMFIYSGNKTDNSLFAINPCAEINLRYTMGFLALELQKRHLNSDFKGLFSVSSSGCHSDRALFLNPYGSDFSFTIHPLYNAQLPIT